jgi:hypothetical protein
MLMEAMHGSSKEEISAMVYELRVRSEFAI